jgi:hypothetical protein
VVAAYFRLMVVRQQLVAFVLAFACLLGGGASSHADSYSPQQIELAGKLGAAVALSRICSGTVPTTSVMRALEASGLTQQDVLGQTAVRERMQSQAFAVISANNQRKERGEPQAEIVKAACDSFRASFGPNGILLPSTD